MQAGLRLNKYIPHQPTPKQAAFLLLRHQEAFYGGAAGGGKSDALLMAALQYVDVPGYSALLLRRTFTDLMLPDAIMDRASQWLSGTDAKFSAVARQWRFPSGATLTFGYLDTENDKYRYQSAQFQFIGFDELTQFRESQYTYLFSRLRRLEDSNVPIRMRAASNPGGIGHDWVKQRFIVEGRAAGRIFIPASLVDNPFLDQETYRSSLEQLDHVTRSQLLEGNWDAAQGNLFRRDWFDVIERVPAGVGERCQWVRYWDRAATEPRPGTDPDYTAGVLMGRAPNGTIYIADVKRFRGTPLKVEETIARVAAEDGRHVAIYMEQEPGSSGVEVIDNYRRRVLAGYDFRADRVSGSKETRARPLSAYAEGGHVKLVAGPWITEFLNELAAYSGDAGQHSHDDQVDAASGAFGVLMQTAGGGAVKHLSTRREAWF